MKNIRKALPFIVPIAGFLIIFIGINIFQYYKVKQTIKNGLIQTTGESELAEIRSFFSGVTNKLNIVRDWGKNGVLDTDDAIDLNKKFMPLVDHQDHLNGIIFANDQGDEYLLINQTPHLITRLTKLRQDKAEMEFAEWSAPDKSIRKWHETTTYDPRSRPWFRQDPSESEIFLSNIYTFYQSKKKGITASVSWTHEEKKAKQHVFAIDIYLDEIELLLKTINKKKASLLFLVNTQNNYFITEQSVAGTSTIENDHLAGAVTALPKIIESWKQDGTPVSRPMELQENNNQWIASFQPLFPEQPFLWIGVISNDEALLGSFETSLFTIDFFDIGIAFTAALLLFFIIWKTGLFRFEEVPPTEEDRLRQYLAAGEGATVEFKSTIRTNLKTGKQGKEIEFAWLKAVTAFLNSQGGTLLLGVDDSGELLGLKADIFENDDKVLLHIKNLINHHIGAEFASYTAFSLLNIEQKQVMMIEVLPATSPVFLKIGKNEEFYIRSGPSSIKLTPSQMVRFVLQHKDEKQVK
ncbi:RNA-binding domain-containing protein [Desulfogranum marinum]|uniref:RNA-binding domain-containing protein n=1 Tax=Desulfogranum marinum TaxID=453220 RepID=UPI0029C856FE|nr:RNA-binding domain-containing protein [Desulfogranum marinum]